MDTIQEQITELKTKATSALILADESRKAARHYDQLALKIKGEIDELEKLREVTKAIIDNFESKLKDG